MFSGIWSQISKLSISLPGEPFDIKIKFSIISLSDKRSVVVFFDCSSTCFNSWYEDGLNLIVWHLEIIVSSNKLNFEVNKIKTPFVGSSKVFNKQLDEDSFNRSAFSIKINFFVDWIDFFPKKTLILRICSILIKGLAVCFFPLSISDWLIILPLEIYVGSNQVDL